MIHLTLPNLILVPLAVNVLLILAWWTLYALRDVARHVSDAEERIYRCAVCRHVYLDARDVPLARCPRCGCLNEAVKR